MEDSSAADAAAVSPRLLQVLSTAQEIGVIGRGSLADHIAHAAAFGALLEDAIVLSGLVLDLGSGGGIPGLVLAERMPEARFVLLDGRQQRSETLGFAVERLGWRDRVSVDPRRAEIAGRDPERRGKFDAVVARSFGRPAVTLECAAPFLKPGGVLVVSEPPLGAATEGRWPQAGVAQFGAQFERSETEPFSFARLIQERPCPDQFPRRTGMPEKRPIF